MPEHTPTPEEGGEKGPEKINEARRRGMKKYVKTHGGPPPAPFYDIHDNQPEAQGIAIPEDLKGALTNVVKGIAKQTQREIELEICRYELVPDKRGDVQASHDKYVREAQEADALRRQEGISLDERLEAYGQYAGRTLHALISKRLLDGIPVTADTVIEEYRADDRFDMLDIKEIHDMYRTLIRAYLGPKRGWIQKVIG